MALDEALLGRARRTGESVLRVYAWSAPTLSLGRHQRARGIYDPSRAGAQGVGVVRRLTGGRALLHHREVTYSVTAPAPPDVSLRRTYDDINGLLLRALAELGVPAAPSARGERLPPPASAPCFERPAEGEIVVDGRKLVASAQYREDGALLQHGSLLIDDDQSIIARLATQPVGDALPAATLRRVLGRAPHPGEVAAALFAAVRVLADPGATPLVLDEVTLADERRARARYCSDDWTWRR
jgi:lipoate-protein ligase A